MSSTACLSMWMCEALRSRWSLIPILSALLLPYGARGADQGPEPPEPVDEPDAKQLFVNNCGVCHSLELPRSQRLNRDTWSWVMDDMVNQFGLTWLSEEQQGRIIDYLAEHYGPDRPRE